MGTQSAPMDMMPLDPTAYGALLKNGASSTGGISCFQRLPVELQVEIFNHCLASYPTFSMNEAPLLLCQVSQIWKGLVHHTPSLWARFQICTSESGATNSEENQRCMVFLAIWLARSKECPLSVRITHDTLGNLRDRKFVQLLSALLPHAHRWKDMVFNIASWSFEPLQDFGSQWFPVLESLTIDMKGFKSPVKHLDILALGLPWAHLTRLHLHLDATRPLTLDDCLVVLTQCVILSECTLDVRSSLNPTSPLPDKVFSLPMLKQLSLTLHSAGRPAYPDGWVRETAESCLVSFLEHLRFSGLRTLRLDWLVEGYPGDSLNDPWSAAVHARFISILSNLSPSLRSLGISYLPLIEPHLLDCIAHLNRVTNLDLRFSLADAACDQMRPHHQSFSHRLYCAVKGINSAFTAAS